MPTVFLTIGRLLYDKGYKELTEASAKLTDCEVQWLGPIDESYPKAVLESTVQDDHSHGLIKYLGETRDVRPYIAKADCIVLPSYHEGLSRTLMEALAMGKPIITTDIPGCRETVNDGINGFLCCPKSTESLLSAMQKFLALDNDGRKRFGLASRIKAEQEFNIKDVIKAYEQLVRTLTA